MWRLTPHIFVRFIYSAQSKKVKYKTKVLRDWKMLKKVRNVKILIMDFMKISWSESKQTMQSILIIYYYEPFDKDVSRQNDVYLL